MISRKAKSSMAYRMVEAMASYHGSTIDTDCLVYLVMACYLVTINRCLTAGHLARADCVAIADCQVAINHSPVSGHSVAGSH